MWKPAGIIKGSRLDFSMPAFTFARKTLARAVWLTSQSASTDCNSERYLSPGMCNCCDVLSPAPGPFPPDRPRRRKRWFKTLLCEASTLRCISSRGRSNPRMVKRRNSPYVSHDPNQRLGTRPDFSPKLLGPMPLSPKSKFAITC